MPAKMRRFGEFDRIISLGCDCQPAYQIRRYTGVVSPAFFDWLYSPLPGLIETLRSAFEDSLDENNLIGTTNWMAETVVNKVTGLDFYHFLPRCEDRAIDHARKGITWAKEIRKLNFLIREWKKAMQGVSRTLFVRQRSKLGLETQSQENELFNVLRTVYSGIDVTLLVIERSAEWTPSTRVDKLAPKYYRGTVKDAKWPGDDTSWEIVLREVGCTRPRV
jgi:hypothetical protein